MTAARFAQQAWSKAEAHLAEARALTIETTPLAVIHLAYYAMFNAARAVILDVEGLAPKKHASVITKFGLLVKDRGSEQRTAGSDLKDVERHRIRADYTASVQVTSQDAADCLRRAEAFLDFCAREFGFDWEEKRDG